MDGRDGRRGRRRTEWIDNFSERMGGIEVEEEEEEEEEHNGFLMC